MISIALPKSIVPTVCQHTFPQPIYFGTSFHCMKDVTFVDICGHTMDDKYEEQEFFIELSGNDFVKLIERDILPEWATPDLLFSHSTANGTLDPITRKIKWVRQRKNCIKSKQ